ncbi:MAG: flagellar hook-basal body complex protein FliE [Hungatella sp.]|nr:flagellar hook-basal body complex protein FliE [Hungatella sp.]
MEGTSFITPMQLWNIGTDLNESNNIAAANAEASLFKSVFKNAIDQVKETQADVEHKQYLLMTGQLDDAHTLPIAEAKAGLTLDVLITLRNKTLEAYNELIKMNV